MISIHVQGCFAITPIHPNPQRRILHHLADFLPFYTAVMFRAAVARALRVAAPPRLAQQFNQARPQVAASLLQNSRTTPSFVIPSIRCYSAPTGLSREEVQGRIMDLLKNFDKVSHGRNSIREIKLTIQSGPGRIKGSNAILKRYSWVASDKDLDLRRSTFFERPWVGLSRYRRGGDGD